MRLKRRRGRRALAGALERGCLPAISLNSDKKAAEVKSSLSQFSRAVGPWRTWKEMGMPRDLALKAARKAVILNYSERGMARMERDLLTMRKSGMSWEDSFRDGRRYGALPGRHGGAGSGSGMGAAPATVSVCRASERHPEGMTRGDAIPSSYISTRYYHRRRRRTCSRQSFS